MIKETPYYAVIFTSREKLDSIGYAEMAERMDKLASEQEGYIGMQSARNEDGFGVTASYWQSLEAIKKWKANTEHQGAQKAGF